ncbi:MAG: hypothetical protein ACYDDN_03725 [Candidatus Desulforudaceae bacterium]|nr:hypothetical protein [Clostridia bacterium]
MGLKAGGREAVGRIHLRRRVAVGRSAAPVQRATAQARIMMMTITDALARAVVGHLIPGAARITMMMTIR